MAHFHPGSITENMTQTNWNPCLYNTTDPYSLYAANARLSRYGATNEAYPVYAQGMSGLSTSLFSGHPWYMYQQSHCLPNKNQCNGDIGVSAVSMATNTTQQQGFGNAATSMTAFQMATDFAGLLDASDPIKCPKPVHPFYWRKRGNSVPTEGMTRTKDKYRVVYTEKQRIGLEKAFKENKFITMKEKTKLSKELDLSERQIKIWFQNRRAKERRQRRKAEAEQDHMINDEQDNESPDSPNSDDASTFSADRPGETHFSPPNYQGLQSFEEPTAKSQCRYQQNPSCVSGTSPMFYQGQIERFSTSPTDLSQKGISLTKCDVSPFTANPDWNLMYRS